MSSPSPESPLPVAMALPAALQHVAIGGVTLVIPLMISDAAGVDAYTRERYIDLAMLALGCSSLLQCWGRRGIGSGFLLPSSFTAIYLPPGLLAAQQGGLGAVAGLALVGGLTEILLSRLVRPLRAFLPTEVMGLVVLLTGTILGLIGLRLMLGFLPTGGNGQGGGPAAVAVAAAALGVIIGVTVWGGPRLRNVAVLLGIAAGSALHLGLDLAGDGLPAGQDWDIGLIVWPLATPSFEFSLLPGVLVGALGCLVRTSGDIVASHRLRDPDWKRPDFRLIERGVLADGLGSMIAGLLGAPATNTTSGSVGLAAATGVTARRVGLLAGAIWVGLALLPGSSAVVLGVPRGVLGAALFFSGCFIVATGISTVAARLLDARRILVVGAALLLGLSYDIAPQIFALLPPVLRGAISSSLVVAMVAAILLGVVLGIGARRRAALSWRPEDGFQALTEFATREAAAAGARADATGRATALLEEFAAAAPALLAPRAGATLEIVIDELHLDLVLRWHGEPLPAPGRLSPDLGPEDPQLAVLLAATLLRRHADRLAAEPLRDGRQELRARIAQ